MPGSGKSTFGRALAKKLNREFIDLDFFISQRFRKSIPEIFASEGEAAFRKREAALLRETGEMNGVVIACGGGTPCFHENMEYMKSRGLTVKMEASRPRLLQRLMLARDRRPMTRGKSESEIENLIDELLEQRSQYYDAARVSLESSQLEDRRQIDATVGRFLEDYADLIPN